jgi:hypothetical protein
MEPDREYKITDLTDEFTHAFPYTWQNIDALIGLTLGNGAGDACDCYEGTDIQDGDACTSDANVCGESGEGIYGCIVDGETCEFDLTKLKEKLDPFGFKSILVNTQALYDMVIAIDPDETDILMINTLDPATFIEDLENNLSAWILPNGEIIINTIFGLISKDMTFTDGQKNQIAEIVTNTFSEIRTRLNEIAKSGTDEEKKEAARQL